MREKVGVSGGKEQSMSQTDNLRCKLRISYHLLKRTSPVSPSKHDQLTTQHRTDKGAAERDCPSITRIL